MEEIKSTRKVQIRDKFGCDFVEYLPSELLDESKQLDLTDEERLAIGVTKCFDVVNNCVIDYDNTEELEAQRLQDLRSKRTPLLEAFDKWEKAVVRGREEDSEEIMSWYRDLLDLKEEAFDNIPARIEYYL